MNLIASACLLALVVAVPAAAQNADIIGTWTVNATLDTGPMPPSTLTLKREAAKIVGVLSGEHGDVPVVATVKDNAVTVSFTITTDDGPMALTMIGTADGDAMKGTAEVGGSQVPWTATRQHGVAAGSAAPGAHADVSGTWEMAVETAAGSGTPTFVLKQDGDRLTGQYTGQLGEAPVTGTVKGASVEFGFDISVQGTTLHVTYAGTVEGSSMKGAVKLADLGEGTFTGKKK
jgi:hypothetical protein